MFNAKGDVVSKKHGCVVRKVPFIRKDSTLVFVWPWTVSAYKLTPTGYVRKGEKE